MNKFISILSTVAILACASASTQLLADEHFNCNGGDRYWTSNPRWEIEQDDFTNIEMNQMEFAMTRFNIIGKLGRSISTVRRNNNPTANQRDGVNNLFDVQMNNLIGRARFSSSTDCNGSDSTYDEVDIYIDQGDNPSTGGFIFNGGPGTYPYQLLALHELGHAMGLAHEFDRATVMKQNITAGGDMGNIMRYHSDDRRGFYSNYAYSGGANVLNSAGTGYWSPAGNNSTLYDLDVMTQNSSMLINGNPNRAPSTMTRGQSYRIPYSIENQSTSTQDVRARMYASNDTTITTNDTLLSTVLYTMGPRTEILSNKYFTLPNNAPTGNFISFGYIVDMPYNNSSEQENNDNTIRFERSHRVN